MNGLQFIRLQYGISEAELAKKIDGITANSI